MKTVLEKDIQEIKDLLVYNQTEIHNNDIDFIHKKLDEILCEYNSLSPRLDDLGQSKMEFSNGS